MCLRPVCVEKSVLRGWGTLMECTAVQGFITFRGKMVFGAGWSDSSVNKQLGGFERG